MSAFIVEDDLIDALLTYATDMRYGTAHLPGHLGHDLDKIGQILLDENYRSVNARYRNRDKPHKYDFKFWPGELSPVQIIKACDCYDYQACETDNYCETEAAMIVKRIRSKAISNLPGYSAAKWGMPDNPGRRKRVA